MVYYSRASCILLDPTMRNWRDVLEELEERDSYTFSIMDFDTKRHTHPSRCNIHEKSSVDRMYTVWKKFDLKSIRNAPRKNKRTTKTTKIKITTMKPIKLKF